MMSLIDEIKKALTETETPLSVRQLAEACPSANDTTLVAGACLKLVNSGEILRTGEPGKYRYSIAMTNTANDATTVFRALALKEPKPGVGKNTGSREVAPTPAAGPAVAVSERTTTPKPTSERRGTGPVPMKASAGDDVLDTFGIELCNDGVMIIATHGCVMELDPAQVLALGDFMERTDKFWRP